MKRLANIWQFYNARFYENERGIPSTARGRYLCCNFRKIQIEDLIRCQMKSKNYKYNYL